jgi:16S rRNA (guanine527-N7)-methyltransferase
MPSSTDVQARCRTLGRTLTLLQADRLARYLNLLVKWNRKMNLVGPSSWEEVLDTLIVDSWHLADFLESLDLQEDLRTLDLGAGAGLPGIPLRMFWSAGTYVLVEPRQKRAIFMNRALAELRLEGTSVAGVRFEQLPADLLPVDLVLSRAFCPWREFLDIARPMLKPAGRVVVLASAEEPDNVPLEWRFRAGRTYPVQGRDRYFWAFSPMSAPS